MARKGSFGRSGTSQNLTMLVYSIMKQQMNDELDAILTAYKTNMEAGMYNAQFNGQNVDGEYVIKYYENMLAGFPPGSTEYESVNSKLQAFKQQYETDVQNLVINAMNSGDKIDFGLLGSGFSNKGISEVELSDIQSWSTEKIAQLEADGNTTQADKLKGAVFVAGFNVENDGKIAAVDRKEMTYAQYAKWLGGQLDSAKASGLGESSQAYREILKSQANAIAQAKVQGQQNASENVYKKLNQIGSGIDSVAKVLIDKYLSSADPVFQQTIYDTLAATPEGSLTPYHDALQALAKARQESGDQTYNAIMQGAELDGIAEKYAQAVSEYASEMNDMLANGLNGLSPQDRKSYANRIIGYANDAQAYISNSGVQFFGGAGKNAMEAFQMDLDIAGVAKSPDASSGSQSFISGLPSAVLGAFKNLGTSLGSMGAGSSYAWLDMLGKGYIDVRMAEDQLAKYDTLTNDGKITNDEMFAAFDAGTLNAGELDTIMSGILANAGALDMPSSNMNPESIIKAYTDAVYGDWLIKNKGSIAISDEAGVIKITEPGNVNLSNAMAFNISGYGLVYVKPQTINTVAANGETSPIDQGKLGGMNVMIYKYPGIGGSRANIGNLDAMAVINGSFAYGGPNGQTYKAPGSLVVPFDTYRKVLSYMNIDVEAESVTSPDQNTKPSINVSFDGVTMSQTEVQNFMADVFTNPDSQYYIAKLRFTDGPRRGELVAPEAIGKDYTNIGLVNPQGDNLSTIDGLFATGREAILNKAKDFITKVGSNAPVTRETVLRAIVDQLPGLSGGIQDQTLRDKLINSKPFQDKFNAMFSDFPVPVQTNPNTTPTYGGVGGQSTIPGKVPEPTPTPWGTGAPGSNPYTSGGYGSFLSGAFRNATGVGMNPEVPKKIAPQVSAAKPTAVPTIKTTIPTYSPAASLPAKPKPTPSTTTGTVGGVNTGYTRGVS